MLSAPATEHCVSIAVLHAWVSPVLPLTESLNMKISDSATIIRIDAAIMRYRICERPFLSVI